MIPDVQAQADAIVEKAVTVVCPGWPARVHPVKVMRLGDPDRVSHGMCPECAETMRAQAVRGDS